MFRLTIWDRHYREVGTIDREIAGTLLDMGAKLQEDYGASYRVEYVEEICTDCGKTPRSGDEAEGREACFKYC